MPALKMTTTSQRWLITLVIFIAVLTTAELFDLKFLFANALYRLEGGQWSLKHHFITETIFHEGARNLNLIAVISLLALTLFQFFREKVTLSGVAICCCSYLFYCLLAWLITLKRLWGWTVPGICVYTAALQTLLQFVVVE